jgi:hypothetical protein
VPVVLSAVIAMRYRGLMPDMVATLCRDAQRWASITETDRQENMMSFTLKIASRALDATGQPRIQAWWPGVEMIVRNDVRRLHEVLAGCWEQYGIIEADYASPGIPQSVLVTELQPGQLVARGNEYPEPWRVVHIYPAAASKVPGGVVAVDYESLDGQIGEVNEYTAESYVQLWNDRMDMIRFDPLCTLLWVQFTDGTARHMCVENAWLLGPTGGTVDRLHSVAV